MAYCRFSEGDVYLVKTPRRDQDEWQCLDCKLYGENGKVSLSSPTRALEHLEDHREAGHEFPREAVIRLENEETEYFISHPTHENIARAVEKFFNFTLHVDSMAFFFHGPSRDWEEGFLTRLEAMSFLAVCAHRTSTSPFLKSAHRFADQKKVLKILENWRKEIQVIPEGEGFDTLPGYSEEAGPENLLLDALFGSVDNPDELKKEMEKALSRVRDT